MTHKPINIVVLISGGGSNLQALIQNSQIPNAPYQIVGVISNRIDAGGLQHAQQAGITSQIIDHQDFDQAMIQHIDNWQPDLVVLAGFMRILTADIVNRYLGRIINIHPSLLPQYTGLNTHQRVIKADEKYHGASVHYVIPELDAGPVIIQERLELLAGESASDLASRVLKIEHRIYAQSVNLISEGHITFKKNNAYLNGELLPAQGYQTSA
jgi:phosphoribosylglycinamide formyltransferase-1